MTRKTTFFKGWSWFKFNNFGLALGTNLKFYTSVGKGSKRKVGRFLGLIRTFVEVTGEKLVGTAFLPPPILSRIKVDPPWVADFSSSLSKVFLKNLILTFGCSFEN